MAQFQLYDDKKPIGDRFTDDDVDAFDRKACSDLVKRLAAGNKILPGRAVLDAFHNGRKVRTYRA